MTSMALRKELQEFICHCIRAWSGETGHAHVEAVNRTGADVTSTKCILDTLKGHCKPRGNEKVATTAYKQLVQGDLGLQEYIEKCKEVTAACNFGTTYNKCLRNAILLGLRIQWVYEKCIKVGDQLTSADVIQTALEVYNSNRQLSIIQSLSATATGATAVQNQSIGELNMVQAKHSKKGPAMEDRSQGTCKSSYYCEATLSHQKKEFPARDAECYNCGKKGHFKDSCSSKNEEKEVGKANDMKRKQKPGKVNDLKEQATAGTWLQQPYAAQHSLPPQKGPQGVTSHHMKMVQVNSFNKQEDNKDIRPLWLTTCPKVQVYKFDCEVDTGAGCNIMPLYI